MSNQWCKLPVPILIIFVLFANSAGCASEGEFNVACKKTIDSDFPDFQEKMAAMVGKRNAGGDLKGEVCSCIREKFSEVSGKARFANNIEADFIDMANGKSDGISPLTKGAIGEILMNCIGSVMVGGAQ